MLEMFLRSNAKRYSVLFVNPQDEFRLPSKLLKTLKGALANFNRHLSIEKLEFSLIIASKTKCNHTFSVFSCIEVS